MLDRRRSRLSRETYDHIVVEVDELINCLLEYPFLVAVGAVALTAIFAVDHGADSKTLDTAGS